MIRIEMKQVKAKGMSVSATMSCVLTALLPAEGLAQNSDLGSGIDKGHFDTQVRPQDDLYRAVNGTWLASTKIPADKSNYGSFSVLADEAEKQLRAIVEELASSQSHPAGSNARKVGDYYASFMDQEKIASLGIQPVAALLAEVDNLKSSAQIPVYLGKLVVQGVNLPLLPYIHQDAKDSSQYAGDLYQGGLSLPDRDFYLIQDDKFRGIRSAFVDHVRNMWALADLPDPETAAAEVLALETELARAQWDKVKRRDPIQRYNVYAAPGMQKAMPGMHWQSFLDAVGYGGLDTILISQPSYVAELSRMVQEQSLKRWKTYLQWRVLNEFAGVLPQEFVAENFAFFGKRLNGIEQIQPRWKRGVGTVESALGEALGRLYVERHFPPENKARMEDMVQKLIEAYGLAIDELGWMSAETKKAARLKLSKFSYKIGYPNEWRDYANLKIIAGDAVGNQRRAAVFEYQRDLNKLGNPIDRNEWSIPPQTVNAYYNPEKNEIVFPAAILQPPFFNVAAEDAVNYGAIGAVIGHEISHGFDDRGSEYDGDGNLRKWWTAEDRKRFDALGQRLAEQFSAYEPIKGRYINGEFTVGENIADLGGVTVAHRAYHLSLEGKSAPVIDGFSADQRLFMGWAQIWRRLYREENLLNRLRTDPHAPSEYRTNGVMVNLSEFHRAFEVREGDQLYKPEKQRIKIW